MVSLKSAVANNKVLHSSFYHAKDGIIRAIWVTDTDAADFVALTVESAVEKRTISYGRIVVLLRLVVGDVSAEGEVFAVVVIAAVDSAGELVETFGGVDDVRVFLCTIAAPRVLAIVLAVVGQAVLVDGNALVDLSFGVGAARLAHSGVGCQKFVGEGGAAGVGASGFGVISYAAHVAASMVVVGQRGCVRIVLANDGADKFPKIAADSTCKEVVGQRGGMY